MLLANTCANFLSIIKEERLFLIITSFSFFPAGIAHPYAHIAIWVRLAYTAPIFLSKLAYWHPFYLLNRLNLRSIEKS